MIRNVLITSIYYWPEAFANAPYVTGLAEHLRSQGDDVTVVTGFPHYPDWARRDRRVAVREVHHGVTLRRRWHVVPRTQSSTHRALYEGSFFLTGLTAIGSRRRPDVVIGITPTLAGAALAAAAAGLYRRPYGLVFQDLIGRAAEQSMIPGARSVASRVRSVELALAARARAVGVVSEGFGRYFEEAGIPPERIRRLRNWTHVHDVSDELVPHARERLGWASSEFVCLHSGNMGHKQGLDNVIDAAGYLDPSVRIVLAGGGNDRPRLEARASRLGLSNLSFLPIQAPRDYEAMLGAADVLLVNQRSTVTDMSLPSRLTSYFAARRPVVAAVARDSETSRELTETRAGLLVEPDDPAALARAIVHLRENPEHARSLAENAQRHAETTLTPASALAEYDRFVDDLTRSAAHAATTALMPGVSSACSADAASEPRR
jgi:glycosyltransferase involved in cell wall biosynthesis